MIKLFYTAYLVNNWIDIIDRHFSKIKMSGLMDQLDEIRLYAFPRNDLLSQIVKNYAQGSKVVISIEWQTENQYEFPALKGMLRDHGDFNLYMHTKGVTKLNDKNYYQVMQWNQYMTDFNVFNYKYCIQKLNEDCDVIGVEFKKLPFVHYSGNFWWSSGNHLEKLRDFKFDGRFIGSNASFPLRHIAEMFICSIEGKYCCMHQSNINLYIDFVKSSDYVINEMIFLV